MGILPKRIPGKRWVLVQLEQVETEDTVVGLPVTVLARSLITASSRLVTHEEAAETVAIQLLGARFKVAMNVALLCDVFATIKYAC